MLRRRYWCEDLRKESDSLGLLNPSNRKIFMQAIPDMDGFIKKIAKHIPSGRSKALEILMLRQIAKNVLSDVALHIQNKNPISREWIMQNIQLWCMNIGGVYQLGSGMWKRNGDRIFRIIRKQLALPWNRS